MRRKTFDALLITVGSVLAAVLLVAGGLLAWGSGFIHDEVHSQLAAERIHFPPKGSDALKPADIGPYLDRYAGQQLLNGPQAKAYADHFIEVHVKEASGGKTYAELSSQLQKNPGDKALSAKVDTVFKGETLRGLLLNAYAFDTIGRIAGIAEIAAFVGAGLLLILVGVGWWHLRRTPPDASL